MEFKLIAQPAQANGTAGWNIQIECGGQALKLANGAVFERSLLRSSQGYPLAAPGAALENYPGDADYEQLCTQDGVIDQLLAQVIQAPIADENEIRRLGAYLFEMVLGQSAWDAIQSAAPKQSIELALVLPLTESGLNRLPWEAMFDARSNEVGKPYSGFLAVMPLVSILRRIPNTNSSSLTISKPPKVLFVIGSELADANVRPGAEYLGLLRGLGASNYSLDSRLLVNVSLDVLNANVRNFNPDIVHIISHGAFDPQGGPVLKFYNPQRSDMIEWYEAKSIIAALKNSQEQMPPLVVLNACSTAEAPPNAQATSLAASLVAAGAAAVIGMSGPITDQACRLFVRSFYQSLLDGKEGNFVQAASIGRRAALFYSPSDNPIGINWALPALLLSEMQPISVQLQENSDRVDRQKIARDFLDPPRFPPFCDRIEFLEWYRRLTNTIGGSNQGQKKDEAVKALAVSVDFPDSDGYAADVKLGRTWLLKMLAAQAFRDGHIPILVTKDASNISVLEYPRTLAEYFDKLVIPAMLKTKETLREIPAHSNLVWKLAERYKTLRDLSAGQALPAAALPAALLPGILAAIPDIGDYYEQTQPLKPEVLAIALREDLLDLLKAVQAQRPEAERGDIRVLLLLDDLHRMGEMAMDVLKLLDRPGIVKAYPSIAVMFTYSEKPLAGQIPAVNNIKKWIEQTNWVRQQPLTVFHGVVPEDGDPPESEITRAGLIYTDFCLGWVDENTKNKKPFILLPDTARDCYIDMMTMTEGKPSTLLNPVFKNYVAGLRKKKARDANDEDLLQKLAAVEQGKRI